MRVLHNVQFARHAEVGRMGDPGGTCGDHGVHDSGARAQAAALGRPEFDAVYVAHPIQDQMRAEIEVRADAA